MCAWGGGGLWDGARHELFSLSALPSFKLSSIPLLHFLVVALKAVELLGGGGAARDKRDRCDNF